MYSNRPNSFNSIRGGGSYSGNSYGRPRFGVPRSNGFSSGRRMRKSQLEGRDINMFIKKVEEVSLEDTFVPSKNFTDFDISSILKENILKKGFTQLTPVQDQAIEPMLQGRDLIGLASTGTGKTAAFLIPIIEKIYKSRNDKALIIAPTRELALQINEELRSLAWNMKIFSALIIGGSNMRRQIFDIKRGSHVVIGTPGRIKDLISQRVLYLDDFSIFVLDEVDLMVDIGFLADVKYFISLLPKVRQSLFFSATISPKVRELLYTFVNDAVTVSVKKQDTSENVEQNVIKVLSRDKKVDQLHDLLIQDGFDKVLVFGRTKHEIEKLNKDLIERGFKVGSIHGNKSQGQRQRMLDLFKRSEIQVLLATDVASRGIDIDNVTHVINYDLPQTYEDYIHRIGRTGRAGKIGTALTFVE